MRRTTNTQKQTVIMRPGSGPQLPPEIELANSVINSSNAAARTNIHRSAMWAGQANRQDDHALWRGLRSFAYFGIGAVGFTGAVSNLALRGVTVETLVESGITVALSFLIGKRGVGPARESSHAGRKGSQYRNHSDDGMGLYDAHMIEIDHQRETQGYGGNIES